MSTELADNIDVGRFVKYNPAPSTQISLNILAESLAISKMDFPTFLREAWPILEPTNPLIFDWYIELICEHLQLVTEGQTKKLLINIPPRSGKSNIVTILWPAWSWTIKPHLRFVTCSYSASLSIKHAVDRRILIESDWYQNKWGNQVQFTDDQNVKNEYENTARGRMIATSVGGTLTGKGGDVIIEDDMLNPHEADSPAARSHTISMHKNVLSTRLDNPMTGIRVIVEQRTHHADLTAHVLKNEKDWTILKLPMIAEQETKIIFPLSKKEIVRAPGSLLSPRRMGAKEVADFKQVMGTRTFVAQCQQDPTSEEGNILKREWWKFYSARPQGFDIIIQSWDMTFKETKEGSYVVGQVWGKRGVNFYLLDQFRDRVDFAATIPAILSLSGKHPLATGILIEDKANGPAIMSQLATRLSGIIPIEPDGTKLARAQSVAPLLEAGNVHLPDPTGTPWVYDFIEECAAFTGDKGEMNDQVDAMSQALSWLHALDYQVQDLSPDVEWIGDQEANDHFVGGFE